MSKPNESRPSVKPTTKIPRPAPIGRRSSSENDDDDLFVNIPPPPITDLERPNLLAGLNVSTILGNNNNNMTSSNLRTPWNVDDARLRPVPEFYPPLDPHCTALICDATPSVVAVRIAECLKRRNISVEYDEETVTANCMTVDRVHFVINLYRGKRSSPAHAQDMSVLPDFSHAVIVECMRTRGNPMSFHRSCKAILSAAMGHTNGADDIQPIRSSPWEFPRLEPVSSDEHLVAPRPAKRRARRSSPTATNASALLSLEHVLMLLKKDRLGAQQLGMESLVMLTDDRTSGPETAFYCSLAVLGAPVIDGVDKDDECLHQIHKWIVSLIQKRKAPNEVEDEEPLQDHHRRSCASSFLFDHDHNNREQHHQRRGNESPDDANHFGILRALALRAFSNALTVMAKQQSKLLRSILHSQAPHLVSKNFLSALIEDLAGASRPPTVGTRLASAHEAALAALCIGVLAEHSDRVRRQLVPPTTAAGTKLHSTLSPVLEALEKARDKGRHAVLAREADRACDVLLRRKVRPRSTA